MYRHFGIDLYNYENNYTDSAMVLIYCSGIRHNTVWVLILMGFKFCGFRGFSHPEKSQNFMYIML